MIPFGDLKKQYFSIKEKIDAVAKRVFNSGWFILGSEVENFEKEFAKYCGLNYCVGVANGMEAIEISLMAHDIKQGDEVITTPLTAMATGLAIIQVGARPIFVDIDQESFNIDVSKIEKVINRKTKVIMPVHLYGQMSNMEAIMEIAKKHNLLVIEDCAQAHGAKFRGRKAGSFGDCGAYSFYPSKNLSAYGDGGCIVTNDKKIAEKMRALRDYGQRGRYNHVYIGLNSRLDELQAAILRVKLKYLDKWNKKRRQLAKIYNHYLTESGLIIPVELNDCFHIYHLYVVRTKKRDELVKYLLKKGIETSIHYPKVVYQQKAYEDFGGGVERCPMAEKYTKEIISLPLYPELTIVQVKYVCKVIKEFFRYGDRNVQKNV